MIVNIFLGANPFFDAYIHSDFLGKLIMVGLIALSVCTWIILVYKAWAARIARRNSNRFKVSFEEQKSEPLNIKYVNSNIDELNPFYAIYSIVKKQTLEILSKNRMFGGSTHAFLSSSDIDFLDSQVCSTIGSQVKSLEKNLYVLSTIVSLSPFLGLLGTVWGILMTFSELQANAAGASSQMVIGGLSLALATTVLGLINAIPALIGYNYLKNGVQEFQTEMEGFSVQVLSAVEMQYRQPEVNS